MSAEDLSTDSSEQEQPPLLGSWRNIYVVLVVELLATTAVLYAMTKWLS